MTPEHGLSALVESLPPQWRQAFASVPRHLFVPDTIWRISDDHGGRLIPLSKTEQPEEWLSRVYVDQPIETQVDDGQPSDDGSGWEVTSSSSQPSVMASMLDALQIEPGMTVLEIGTGTGWNAALMAAMGADVTTVEIDPELARWARSALDRAGFEKVTTVVGDGADGGAANAQYDRVIATAGVVTVPHEWVRQTVRGGRLVVPMNNTYQPLGVVGFDVGDDGTANGRIGGSAAFMRLRSQRVPRVSGGTWGLTADMSTTDIHPYHWGGDRNASTAIGIRMGNGTHRDYEPHSDNTGVVWLRHPESRSWASIDTCGGPPYVVKQAGPRRLLNEVLSALRWWSDSGSPELADWAVEVSPQGQSITVTHHE